MTVEGGFYGKGGLASHFGELEHCNLRFPLQPGRCISYNAYASPNPDRPCPSASVSETNPPALEPEREVV